MEKKSYRLLVIGNAYDNHIVRFIKNLKRENPLAIIDIFTFEQSCKVISEDVILNVNNVIYRDKLKIRNRGLRILTNAFLLYKQFRKISKYLKYDIINLHFPTYEYSFVLRFLRKMSPVLILTPWGSDVYRVNKIQILILKKLYCKANNVCGTGNRFSQDVLKIFGFSKEKFVNLDIGSETIDYISEHINKVSSTEAKKNIGLDEDTYTIVCGYNGAIAQNHEKIIEAVYSNKTQLPQKLVLLFPVTYGGSPDYFLFLKRKVNELDIKAIFFEEYLSLEELFILRMATDMFIHVQSTDANSATVQEYILCKKKVLNGSWLRYGEMEKFGMPYFLVNYLDNLSNEILKVFTSEPKIISDNVISYIESYGWKQWIKKWDMFFNSCIKE